ncbi:uncharacterized protein TNCT_88581 [Trichonephila clavata]|uniref:C2H2-type domain-containing protein n=1 Tax=Trichonephila clavata TaxID=2740835 RepID=A0A8X6FU97_TRICU|nr:uncharacterized protein TNCT_88581 [Trichonephila clavata]
MDIEKIFEDTDFPINDKVLASADFGDLSSELDVPFDGVLRGTLSCDKCDSVFTHRCSLRRHQITIHATSPLIHCKICNKRFNIKDNFFRHSKIHKLTPITMKLSETANGEENSSASTPSEAVPGPSTTTETTLSNHGRTSVSSISTAPSRKRTVSSTFRSRNACLDTFEVYTFFPDTLTSKDLTVSLHSIKTEISNKISETASSKQGVKWYLNSCVHFIRKITTEDFESCTSYFRSKCCISLNQEIPDVETSIAKVIASCNEFENKGSGWEFQEVVKNELKIAIYKPLAAASYIPLPPKLKNKKAILNIKNENQRCFLWFVKKSVLDAHIVDCRKHKEQKIKMPENKWLEFENFKFNLPVPYTIYANIESLIVKINSSTPDPERSFTVSIANHIPCGYAYVVIGPDGNFKNPPAVYRGENAVDHFLKKHY